MDTMPRFLCDEMLGQLCRYLRAAGYDTLLAKEGARDRVLLQRCHDEGRFFLTQDQLIREHKAARDIALILPHGELDQLIALLDARFQLDWLSRAFSRCLVDNTPLQQADAAAAARAPADAMRANETLMLCPACGRVYWQGSHYKRMCARLAAWQAARTQAASRGAAQR